MRLTYRHTIASCCVGFFIQALVINLAPLLFLTFQREFAFSDGQIAFLIIANFGTQLVIDLTSTVFVRFVGVRGCLVGSCLFAAAGLLGMVFLPDVMPPYAGMLIAVAIYSVGAGLIEVLVSPVVESCPTQNKTTMMSMLHSFYCWGYVLVVLLSTLFFVTAGVTRWRLLCGLWAVIPLCNAGLFAVVPLFPLETGANGSPVRDLLKRRLFWLLLVLMLCSGAAEQAMAQWASSFTEEALRVSKTVGDLAGPCAFAALEGLARLLYSRFGDRIPLQRFMLGSAILCVGCYLLATLTHTAIAGLIGCAVCGFSVGIMWPGSLSVGARALPGGGTVLFSLLALGGDIGCILGPGTVGVVTQAQGNPKLGLLSAIVFPLLLILTLPRFPQRKLGKER